ncbi:uncharacterized protein [Palaemon carinicauda]|uniref:uncharacterized protein isoform X2 n=1 Tax=Palaemon carinicauda TaxID=392227 RepID=UPI0035B65359
MVIHKSFHHVKGRGKTRRSALISCVLATCLIVTGSATMLYEISIVWGFLLILIGVIEIIVALILCFNPCSDLDDLPLMSNSVLTTVPETHEDDHQPQKSS